MALDALAKTISLSVIVPTPLLITFNLQPSTSIFDKVRPLTSNIALEMGYATQSHQELLFATGVVLFVFILILNLVISKLSSKEGK